MTNTGLRKMCTWLLVLAVLHQTGNLCASAVDAEDNGIATDTTGTTSPEPTTPTTVVTLSSEATSATTVTSTEDTIHETAGSTTEQPTSTSESITASTVGQNDVATSASSDVSTANSTEADEVTTVNVTTTETIEGTTSNITDTGSGGDSKDEPDKGDIRLGIGITAAFLLVIGLSGALFYVIVRRHNRNYSRLDEELLVNYNNGDNISNASSDVSETIDPSGDLELDMDPIGTELQGRTLQTF